MSSIKVLTMAEVWPGMYIAEPDSDYPLDSLVPFEDYDPDEQDWNRVTSRSGYVDIAKFALEYHNGDPYVAEYQTSATVWVLGDLIGARWVPFLDENN